MPSVTKENYLKALYFLHQKSDNISVTDLGKHLGVSKPTVNDMVKKFVAKGWLIYEKYKPLKLSESGLKAAALIVRKHRLTEMFLFEFMGFGWEEVHEIAEEIEHIHSEIFFNRMDEMLSFPDVDPHGSPIPDKHGNLDGQNYILLSNIDQPKTVVLRGLRDSSKEFLLYLNKKDITLGTQIEIKAIEPFDGNFTVEYGNNHTEVLSKLVSNRLLVQLV